MIGPEIKTLFKIKVGAVIAEHPVGLSWTDISELFLMPSYPFTDESSENGSAEDEGEEAGGEEASAEGKEGDEEKAEGEDAEGEGEDEEAEGEAEGGENESIGSNDAGPSTAKVR